MSNQEDLSCMETTVVQTTAGVNGLKVPKVPNVYGVSCQKIHLMHAAKHTTIVVEHPALVAQVAIDTFYLALIK
jgi:hypothetical protein